MEEQYSTYYEILSFVDFQTQFQKFALKLENA